ncbi:16S rRNA (cytosine(967)-C(5))-methyltransferase RsmB [Desulfovirgula thermocuniculi]|uniref:16S rRNA (cytosine(967)-C(5))-methyltransferase RsmB n=1 Tax=Desulfovirgula thermocuniculi TaxID=348842 RepID=UPI00040D0964|nr:16S rRNA (cytosine(967)-C(5))-methyltransferase RsmB [Desulfovirgula thermocuniculi]
MVTAREVALKVLHAVDAGGAYANIALDRALERHGLGRLDRSLATELVYGVLRRRNTLDWYLDHFTRHPLSSQDPWLKNILRLGAYQILYMDKIPVSAACHQAVELAKKYGRPGAAGFVNGVLRSLVRGAGQVSWPGLQEDPVAHIALKYSHPEWVVRRWVAAFGAEETMALCAANNRPAPYVLRTNTLKTDRPSLLARLAAEGVQAAPTSLTPEGITVLEHAPPLRGFPPFEEGLFLVQDEGSILVGHALSPRSGARVLDAAAAPGGKTTHLAQLMQDRGEIIALDVHPRKLKLVEDNCRRLGISCVRTALADARRAWERWPEWADFVLLDAPCSGLGVLRRRPDARWHKKEETIAGMAALQEELLEGVAPCVRPGGVLVYSTCTLTEEENLAQIKAFLARHPEFTCEDLRPYLPAELHGERSLTEGYLLLLPHRHGTDGFFLARLRKKDMA